MKLKGQGNQPNKWLMKLKGSKVKFFNIFLLIAFILSGCFSTSPVYKNIPKYEGPKITKIVVDKSQRKLYFLLLFGLVIFKTTYNLYLKLKKFLYNSS